MIHNGIQSRIFRLLIILLALIFLGTIGYHYFGKLTWFDALYMTIIIITTTGFGEIAQLNTEGRIFTIFLLLTSVGFVTYAISALGAIIMDGQLMKSYKERKKHKKIQTLNNHTIICGYGRNGRQATVKLYASNESFIIIDKDQEKMNHKNTQHLGSPIILIGDATQDEILENAGIHNAKALIACLPNDADNLFIVLTAKQLNPNLKIVSRASNTHSVKKLKIAGADYVIMPDKIGGEHMASLIAMPSVIEFLDTLSVEGSYRNNMIEVEGNRFKPQYLHKTLSEINIRRQSGVLVIGHKNVHEEYLINPEGDTLIKPAEKYILLGKPNQIEVFKTYYLLSS